MGPLKNVGLVVALSVAAGSAEAQIGMFSPEQRVAITSEWTGERFPDGRPKVADGLLERMKEVTAEEAWGVLVGAGYKSQFEGGWKEINAGSPGRRLVGRVVTAVFVGLPDEPSFGAPETSATARSHVPASVAGTEAGAGTRATTVSSTGAPPLGWTRTVKVCEPGFNQVVTR